MDSPYIYGRKAVKMEKVNNYYATTVDLDGDMNDIENDFSSGNLDVVSVNEIDLAASTSLPEVTSESSAQVGSHQANGMTNVSFQKQEPTYEKIDGFQVVESKINMGCEYTLNPQYQSGTLPARMGRQPQQLPSQHSTDCSTKVRLPEVSGRQKQMELTKKRKGKICRNVKLVMPWLNFVVSLCLIIVVILYYHHADTKGPVAGTQIGGNQGSVASTISPNISTKPPTTKLLLPKNVTSVIRSYVRHHIDLLKQDMEAVTIKRIKKEVEKTLNKKLDEKLKEINKGIETSYENRMYEMNKRVKSLENTVDEIIYGIIALGVGFIITIIVIVRWKKK